MSTSAELPPGWCWTTVPQLLIDKLCNGISVKGADTPPGTPALKLSAMGDNGFNYGERRYIPIDADTSRALAIREGDFFVTRGNGSLRLVGRGTLAQAPPDQVVFPDTMIRLRLPDVGLLRKYISAVWQSGAIRCQIESRARTTAGIYKISQQDIEELRLPLPPLNEQRRIVAKVEELFSDLDAAVAALERVRVRLKRYRAAVLKAAIDGKLTEEWRSRHPDAEPASALLDRISADRRRRWEDGQRAKFAAAGKEPPKGWQAKYPEPAPINAGGLPPMPAGWCWATVEQSSHYAKYGSSAKTDMNPAGVPVLRMGNIQDGQLDLADLKYLPTDHDEFPDLLLEPGDLLFNRTNSAELVGKSAVYQGNPSPCSYASYLIAVRFVTGLRPEFAGYFLNSSAGRAWIASVVSQQVGQANVNGSKLLALTLPVPPLAEQTAIIEEVERRLSVVDRVAAQVQANLIRAGRLRQGILKRAFDGRLVPQDPADEPATVLLDRLRAARTAPPGPASVRKRRAGP